MTGLAIGAGINALSAIASGFGRGKLRREMRNAEAEAMKQIDAYESNPLAARDLAFAESRANRGLDAASLAIREQEAARGMSSGISALSRMGRGGSVAGISRLNALSNQSALQTAQLDSQARGQNRQNYISALNRMAGRKDAASQMRMDMASQRYARSAQDLLNKKASFANAVNNLGTLAATSAMYGQGGQDFSISGLFNRNRGANITEGLDLSSSVDTMPLPSAPRANLGGLMNTYRSPLTPYGFNRPSTSLSGLTNRFRTISR
jgi:hypothetical protein